MALDLSFLDLPSFGASYAFDEPTPDAQPLSPEGGSSWDWKRGAAGARSPPRGGISAEPGPTATSAELDGACGSPTENHGWMPAPTWIRSANRLVAF